MRDFLGTVTGKAVKAGLHYRRGGGQALPGLVVEKLFPGYVRSMLAKLPDGVVIITGTNGKTTTTKMVVHLLEANGKRVLTNSTGSNLSRGIASSLSQHARISGRLPYDIAVLEVDEAAARRLAETVAPKYLLALNVSRDQLDRYGEVDAITSYMAAVMEKANIIITNARDPQLSALARRLKDKEVSFFGFSDKLVTKFPNDYELAAVGAVKSREKFLETDMEVELADFRENSVKYKIDGKSFESELKITGQHNYLNGAAALALAKKVLPEAEAQDLVRQLAQVSLAFGRGEKYRLPGGTVIELVLVKNPASFTQALASYGGSKANLMIAINDNIADGRDVSWLWDVNFSPLASKKVALTSGRRAADMALRLSYDDIKTAQIEPDLVKAVSILSGKAGDKVILATYTAMLQLYKLLSGRGERMS
jgi:UDP-N-acetylmuramyl tripeptide synthase